MAVRIRLARFGRLHRPFYRIGIFDSRMRRDGSVLEYVGYYDPLETTGQRLKLKKDHIEHWLAKGALPSETIRSFLKDEGIEHAPETRNKKRNAARAAKRPRSEARGKAKKRKKSAKAT